jgi:hypothetical protein
MQAMERVNGSNPRKFPGLVKRTRHTDPDHRLTPAERAIGVAFRRMAKEHLYWVMMHIRWRENWDAYTAMLRPGMLALAGGDGEQVEGLLQQARKSMLEQLLGHGMGRHSAEEIHQIGIHDVTAISDFLADKPFFIRRRADRRGRDHLCVCDQPQRPRETRSS